MTILMLLIPLIGALLGWGISLLLCRYIPRKLASLDVSRDMDGLLNHHLDALVVSLKQQIPVAGMFMTGSLTDKLKGQAKVEIVKMIPKLQQKLIDRYVRKNLILLQWGAAAFGFVLGCLQLLATMWIP